MSPQKFIYLYARHRDDEDLCRLEMRSFFGFDSLTNVLFSSLQVEPSRSPFMKERLDVLFKAESWDKLIQQAASLEMGEETFKVVSLNTRPLNSTPKMELVDRRKLEREIGLQMNGEPDLNHPEDVFGFAVIDGHWYFGKYVESESVWRHHQNKPHSYSTALSTRLARTVANIAAPNPEGVKVIDPCCGIGNVLVEALSMGFDIVGSDINPLVTSHTSENIAYFGYACEVKPRPIADITKTYDVAIIDMPYNIFSKASPGDQQDILVQARRIAKKVVVVTIDTIDDMIEKAGFTIVDRCEAKKSVFVRQVLVCE
ncbi:TRM11 family SAM-dependent methyltransferase [Sporosarcina ureilytica]|uniref:RNA methyltransferase n=1 Tax=Sporosarcina ureilytica TaxID=298596 RepID=A0A1D8JEC6_9BACL|nr:RNA methyltransferase [Sporosarcina ureilytica]AOV07074.1 RNA methyltransferase [Sporosarcina ureilytica]